MKTFYCACGQQLFFDSHQCVYCQSRVGFAAAELDMVSLHPDVKTPQEEGAPLVDPAGRRFYLCDNELAYGNCNWLRDEHEGPGLCVACCLNRTIPNLSYPENHRRWHRLEQAKKRLIYTLLTLKLPLMGDVGPSLCFDFVEDGRSNVDFADEVHNTGYLAGVITVNLAEADDVAMESQRVAVNEQYRTLLGHMRHESGHFYLDYIRPGQEAAFSRCFGDPQRDYGQALQHYYEHGPPGDWQSGYISAYASAHPIEDWAETWGHYLHITDVLETAVSHGVLPPSVNGMSMAERIDIWRGLSLTLNELNRSIGHRDAYPFVLNDQVANKLVFVDKMAKGLRTPAPAEK